MIFNASVFCRLWVKLDQGCQVGLFEAKYDKFGLFKTVGLKICVNLLSSWPFFQVKAYLVFGFFPQKFIW